MNDPRLKLPECPLQYQVPLIPGAHTALVISITPADVHWQEKVLPWTLASLINNTDIVMKGVRLFIICENGTRERIQTALKRFDLPKGTIARGDMARPPFLTVRGYDSVCMLDIHYWAFRGISKSKDAGIKLPFGHVLRHNWGWAVADYSLHAVNGTPSKERSQWLHDAHRAVYGENYSEENRNLAAYFFNDSEPNWLLDASILHYQTDDINASFLAFSTAWRHLGKDALLSLWLLKNRQHAYTLRKSIAIQPDYTRAPFARLCDMRFATLAKFRHATEDIMGAQLNIAL